VVRARSFPLLIILSLGLSRLAPSALAQPPAGPAGSASAAATRDRPDTTFSVPAPVGFVNDFANLLSDESEEDLTDIVLEVREKSRGEIAIVTLSSLDGRTPQAVAMAIGNSWGVGYSGAPDDPRTNTAVVVLVAPTERHVRIELGKGAQAFISDAQATEIAEAMSPCFAKGDFARGLRVGVVALATLFAQRFDFTLTASAPFEPCSPR
jgi:uncharacterized protein